VYFPFAYFINRNGCSKEHKKKNLIAFAELIQRQNRGEDGANQRINNRQGRL
jgi:hypothetical protein